MFWICTGVAFGFLLYWLFAPREEEVILLMSSASNIAVNNG